MILKDKTGKLVLYKDCTNINYSITGLDYNLSKYKLSDIVYKVLNKNGYILYIEKNFYFLYFNLDINNKNWLLDIKKININHDSIKGSIGKNIIYTTDTIYIYSDGIIVDEIKFENYKKCSNNIILCKDYALYIADFIIENKDHEELFYSKNNIEIIKFYNIKKINHSILYTDYNSILVVNNEINYINGITNILYYQYANNHSVDIIYNTISVNFRINGEIIPCIFVPTIYTNVFIDIKTENIFIYSNDSSRFVFIKKYSLLPINEPLLKI